MCSFSGNCVGNLAIDCEDGVSRALVVCECSQDLRTCLRDHVRQCLPLDRYPSGVHSCSLIFDALG